MERMCASLTLELEQAVRRKEVRARVGLGESRANQPEPKQVAFPSGRRPVVGLKKPIHVSKHSTGISNGKGLERQTGQ